MKIKVSVLIILLCGIALGGCGIFNSGCKCPKVSYNTYPKK